MPKYDNDDFVMLPVPRSMFAAVCAVLGGGVSLAAVAAASPAPKPSPEAVQAAEKLGDQGGAPAAAENVDDGTVDAHGWPWSADMHASTKGLTKEGLWRMKVGVSRPDPKPGFPKDAGTGTGSTSSAPSGGSSAPAAAADEDDEFAAFRQALDADAAKGAAAGTPARKWTDADLGALCNQAAVKLGDPAPIKELIGKYVPEGTVPHSRNIPEDKREEFAKAVEAKADIEFAG